MTRTVARRAVVCLGLSVFAAAASATTRVRTPVRVPDVPGYVTVACDLHTHTVFSDGSVWPDIRAEEAWREGLDVVAITDHIEYQPHSDDLPTNHNRPHEIAEPLGTALGVAVVRGSEITRRMPPGHLNAIFLEDAARLDVADWREAVAEAHRQRAFIFWNHPGWRGQQPDGVARWYDEHTQLVKRGMLHGIEVVNTRTYYPEAHRWCVDKGLTILANSDVHYPSNLDYHVHDRDHRPLTLVFAREESIAAVREALFAGRTAAYSGRMLIGDERFLRPIFERSVSLRTPRVTLDRRGDALVQLHNDSEVDYDLALRGAEPPGVSIPAKLRLPGGRTALLRIRDTSEAPSESGRLLLRYTATNLKIAPGEGLPVEFDVELAAFSD